MAPIAGGGIIEAMVFNPGLSYKIMYLVRGTAGILTFILTFKLPPESSLTANPKKRGS